MYCLALQYTGREKPVLGKRIDAQRSEHRPRIRAKIRWGRTIGRRCARKLDRRTRAAILPNLHHHLSMLRVRVMYNRVDGLNRPARHTGFDQLLREPSAIMQSKQGFDR